ncbi:MAG: hypothetical protein WCD69_25155 [Xanthobacteraceae bacterium]
MSTLALPSRGRGRLSETRQRRYDDDLRQWCESIKEIDSTLDFKVSARGWCYILEQHQAIDKGDFDKGERIINACRKSGLLPLDICCEDDGRQAEHLETLDQDTPTEFAQGWIDYLDHAHQQYCPFSFWDGLDTYVQMTVEKVDLKSLFSSVCRSFHLPLQNISGWNDINSRAAIMRRFAEWEQRGKRIVLLHCGDHDPGGLHISEFLRSNMDDLAAAVGWSPDNLIIERFGLNADFIREQNLTWIDNLITGSGGDLTDPRHPDHFKPYVQSYLSEFGGRKVEANALVVSPDAGRKLCRDAILKYVPETAINKFERQLRREQEQARRELMRLRSE